MSAGRTIVGVLFVKLRTVVWSFDTVLAFWSFSVPVTTFVVALSAGNVVLLVVQAICVAGPKTVTGATAVRPSELEATTLHGCVAEFVAVADVNVIVIREHRHPPV